MLACLIKSNINLLCYLDFSIHLFYPDFFLLSKQVSAPSSPEKTRVECIVKMQTNNIISWRASYQLIRSLLRKMTPFVQSAYTTTYYVI